MNQVVVGTGQESMQQVIERKLQEYARSNEIQRAMLFGSEVTMNEHLKRRLLELESDAKQLGDIVNCVKNVPGAFDRSVQKFFKPSFPNFTNGASIAFGTAFNKAMEYVQKDGTALRQQGKYVHVVNLTMQILQRSRCEFFVNLRKNKELEQEFKELLTEYCKLMWYIAMQQAGTVYSKTLDLIQAK